MCLVKVWRFIYAKVQIRMNDFHKVQYNRTAVPLTTKIICWLYCHLTFFWYWYSQQRAHKLKKSSSITEPMKNESCLYFEQNNSMMVHYVEQAPDFVKLWRSPVNMGVFHKSVTGIIQLTEGARCGWPVDSWEKRVLAICHINAYIWNFGLYWFFYFIQFSHVLYLLVN